MERDGIVREFETDRERERKREPWVENHLDFKEEGSWRERLLCGIESPSRNASFI